MVNLALDDETYTGLQTRAEREGVSVEDWLRRIARDESSDAGQPISREKWLAKLHAFARTGTRTGRPVDDSRESIYD